MVGTYVRPTFIGTSLYGFIGIRNRLYWADTFLYYIFLLHILYFHFHVVNYCVKVETNITVVLVPTNSSRPSYMYSVYPAFRNDVG